jgi:hypothetical protein
MPMTDSTMRRLLTLGMVTLAVAGAVCMLLRWRGRGRIKAQPTASALGLSPEHTNEERPTTAPYKFTLLKPDGSITREFHFDCDSDDLAIDYADDLNHPGEIQVHRGERLVGVCAAVARDSTDDAHEP